MIDVLCATLGQRQPLGLEHIGEHRLQYDGSAGWAKSSNLLFDRSENDVLFLDDDIELTPTSLATLAAVLPHADVIGFTLCTGESITSAGFEMVDNGGEYAMAARAGTAWLRPGYVAHVTASCMFIKRRVLDAGIRFEVWPGQHYEDVAFTFQCWLAGFRVAYAPGLVYHHLNTGVGVGATKSMLPTFQRDREVNGQCLGRWIAERDIKAACRRGVIPVGPRGLW